MARRNGKLGQSRIQLLRDARRRVIPRKPDFSRNEIAACLQLMDLGYLDGWVTLEDGKAVRAIDLRITRSGEELLEELGYFDIPSLRLARPRTARLLKALAYYFLLLGFLVLLKASNEHTEVLTGNNIKTTVRETNHYTIALHHWNVGVCGIPPAE
jgi:hypothetical protein